MNNVTPIRPGIQPPRDRKASKPTAQSRNHGAHNSSARQSSHQQSLVHLDPDQPFEAYLRILNNAIGLLTDILRQGHTAKSLIRSHGFHPAHAWRLTNTARIFCKPTRYKKIQAQNLAAIAELGLNLDALFAIAYQLKFLTHDADHHPQRVIAEILKTLQPGIPIPDIEAHASSTIGRINQEIRKSRAEFEAAKADAEAAKAGAEAAKNEAAKDEASKTKQPNETTTAEPTAAQPETGTDSEGTRDADNLTPEQPESEPSHHPGAAEAPATSTLTPPQLQPEDFIAQARRGRLNFNDQPNAAGEMSFFGTATAAEIAHLRNAIEPIARRLMSRDSTLKLAEARFAALLYLRNAATTKRRRTSSRRASANTASAAPTTTAEENTTPENTAPTSHSAQDTHHELSEIELDASDHHASDLDSIDLNDLTLDPIVPTTIIGGTNYAPLIHNDAATANTHFACSDGTTLTGADIALRGISDKRYFLVVDPENGPQKLYETRPHLAQDDSEAALHATIAEVPGALDLGTTTATPNRAIKIAADALYPICQWPGCTTAGCHSHYHHLRAVKNAGPTVINNIIKLCPSDNSRNDDDPERQLNGFVFLDDWDIKFQPPDDSPPTTKTHPIMDLAAIRLARKTRQPTLAKLISLTTTPESA